MIFQDDLLFPHLPARDNIGFGLKRWPKDRAADRIDEVAQLCGVDHLLDRRPETLSGGERQRVGLARSLAPRPRLLLCDEPVSALDVAGRNALIDRLKAVQRSQKIPVLYVTHSPAEAATLGDTLFLLDRGQIVEQGAPLEILSRCRDVELNQWEELRNVFSATVIGHSSNNAATFLGIPGGPALQVSALDLSPGTETIVAIRASDVIVASGPGIGLSARNVLAGVVEQVVPHGADAEVIVRTENVAWMASVVASAVDQLGLAPGSSVYLVIKARSCRVTRR
jgi:molybdate transport system ATP-binding protein